MNYAFYIANCLANIAHALDKLPPPLHHETWQEVGQIVAMPSLIERHARLSQLSALLQDHVAASPSIQNSKLKISNSPPSLP